VGAVPIIAGITGEGTKVAAAGAKKCKSAGATGAPVYPNHGWLRFDFQKGRHRIFTRRSGKNRPPVHLVPVPRRDEASYDLDTQLAIATQPGVVATKNGVTLKIVLDAKPKPFWSGHDLPSLCHNQRPQGSS
jgi:4-hydroxy-tetrahydrodipicolinate synthase